MNRQQALKRSADIMRTIFLERVKADGLSTAFREIAAEIEAARVAAFEGTVPDEQAMIRAQRRLGALSRELALASIRIERAKLDLREMAVRYPFTGYVVPDTLPPPAAEGAL